MELGQKIRLLRLSKNPPLRQWQLAQIIGVCPQTLSMIETGRKSPSKKILAALSKQLNQKLGSC